MRQGVVDFFTTEITCMAEKRKVSLKEMIASCIATHPDYRPEIEQAALNLSLDIELD